MSSSFDILERLRIQGDDGPNAQMRAPATQQQQHFTDSASSERIFCTLNGPLSTSIWVLDKRDNPTSIEPYLQLTAEGTSTWHPISQTPMTKPPVSSILVRVFALEYWEDEWLLSHRGHSEPNWQLTADPQYGMLPGYGERPCLGGYTGVYGFMERCGVGPAGYAEAGEFAQLCWEMSVQCFDGRAGDEFWVEMRFQAVFKIS
ncbi:hypothetical protein V499_02647 [Pseudogymnoascus sp. VKM F-103]|nr:hypothetical protein V499_02647 [Pseudogymnoascus sp. VKM F-103]